MKQHRFALALCALVSSLLLVGVANAYPTTSTTTVKKTYRPLDLDLNTVVGSYGGYDTNLDFTATSLDLTIVYSGTFTGVGYDASGNAGFWVYELNADDGVGGLTVSGGVSPYPSDITVSALAPYAEFGRLTYLGAGDYTSVPSYEDTPQLGDVFKLYTTTGASGGVDQLLATVGDANGDIFAVKLLEELVHVGPYILVCSEGSCPKDDEDDDICVLNLDDGTIGGRAARNTLDCDDPSDEACVGRVTALDATSVPEPGTLALFGLGVVGLGIRFRSRRKAPRV